MNGQQASGVSTQRKEDGMCNAHQPTKANDEVETRTEGNVDAYQNRQRDEILHVQIPLMSGLLFFRHADQLLKFLQTDPLWEKQNGDEKKYVEDDTLPLGRNNKNTQTLNQ